VSGEGKGRLRRLAGAKMFSAAGFVMRALAIAAVFTVAHALGLREHTTFLSGTAASVDGGMDRSVVLGVIYLATYHAFVLLGPILLLAAGLLWLWERLLRASQGRRISPPADP